MSLEKQAITLSALPLIFPSEENKREAIDPSAAWHFYSHSIRRDPKNLKLHTHRVFFAIQQNNAEHLSGSLQDLFYILKDAGESLRIRLLKASIPCLNKQDTIYFAMWIKLGINKGIGYRWAPGAVLSDGLYGPDHALITSTNTGNSEDGLSPLEQARASMEYGQLDVAETILLEALEGNADNKELQEELEYLTQYAKSRQIEPQKPNAKGRLSSTLGKIKNRIFH